MLDSLFFLCYNQIMKNLQTTTIQNSYIGNPKLSKSQRGYSICELSIASPFRSSRAFFNLVNTEYPTLHEHNHWEIFVIIEGKIMHDLNGKQTILSKGDCVILRPQDVHNLTFVNNKHIRYLHANFGFDQEFAETLFALYTPIEELKKSKKPLSFFLTNEEVTALFEKLLYIQTLGKQAYETNTKLLINFLTIKFFEQRQNLEDHYPNWLKQFLNYIHNPNHLDQSIPDLAKQTSYSYTQLSRLFKQYFNMSLSQYILNIKMTYAKRLLRTTDMTILQIATSMLFYDSIATFNHNFKKFYSMTPSEYRRSCAQKRKEEEQQ